MSGLESSLFSALAGLKTAQEGLSVTSHNVQNAMTPGFIRQEINQQPLVVDGVGSGSYVKSIERKVDSFLMAGLRDQQSIFSRSEAINDILAEVQVLLGSPDSYASLNVKIDQFFAKLNGLSLNPENIAARKIAVDSAKSLADHISSMAYDLQKMRYNTDLEIESSTVRINGLIKDLHETNGVILRYTKGGSVLPSILQKRDDILQSLTKEINVKVRFADDQTVRLSTGHGISLLDIDRYELTYQPALSIDSFLQDVPSHEILVQRYSDTTKQYDGIAVELASKGLEETVETTLSSGKLKGLLEIRDVEIPRILAQLDNFSSRFAETFNAIHNKGGGVPPAESLTGAKKIKNTDLRDFDGSFRMAVLQTNGEPVTRANGQKLNPLTLDLGSLDDGNGVGRPSVQTIIDEINEYFHFAPTETSVSLGPLRDLKIVATSDFATAPNGTFNFDFELDNDGQTHATFEVQGITVTDGGAAGLTTALPSAFTVTKGSRIRTGSVNTVDFAGGGGGPYFIEVDVKVTDENGIISTSVLRYKINDNPTDLNVRNDRYVAMSATGDGEIIPSNSNKSFAIAEIVDEKGEVVEDGQEGFLRIRSLDPNYGIFFDELDSRELGLPGIIEPTNRHFSHFFNLNNFFVENETLRGSAQKFTVRDDIQLNSNLISRGLLRASPTEYVQKTVGISQAEGRIMFDGNPSINDTLTINGVTFTFVAAAATDNEVTIGASRVATLANLAAKLNATNPTTAGNVERATYNVFASEGLDVRYDEPGSSGNSFTISGNFATIGVSVNNEILSTTPSGQLFGGNDGIRSVPIEPNTFQVGEGANEIIIELITLSSKSFNFNSAGGLPTSSNSFTGYIADIISFSSSVKISYESEIGKNEGFLKNFEQKIQTASGVKMDEEMVNLTKYQAAYRAAAKVVVAVQELFDELLKIF